MVSHEGFHAEGHPSPKCWGQLWSMICILSSICCLHSCRFAAPSEAVVMLLFMTRPTLNSRKAHQDLKHADTQTHRETPFWAVNKEGFLIHSPGVTIRRSRPFKGNIHWKCWAKRQSRWNLKLIPAKEGKQESLKLNAECPTFFSASVGNIDFENHIGSNPGCCSGMTTVNAVTTGLWWLLRWQHQWFGASLLPRRPR